MKRMKYPKTMQEAKDALAAICKGRGVEIAFDDPYGNFGSTMNQCVSAGNSVECAKYQDWNYALLVAAVMHELGHVEQGAEIGVWRHRFANEFDAWNRAMRIHAECFGRNFGVRQCRYMMTCLGSYLPDYNDATQSKDGIGASEGNFWCPKCERVLTT